MNGVHDDDGDDGDCHDHGDYGFCVCCDDDGADVDGPSLFHSWLESDKSIFKSVIIKSVTDYLLFSFYIKVK